MILFYIKFESNIKNLFSQVLPIMNKSLNKDMVKVHNKKNKIFKKKKKREKKEKEKKRTKQRKLKE